MSRAVSENQWRVGSQSTYFFLLENSMQDGEKISSSLSRPRLCSCKYVPSLYRQRYSFLLNQGRCFEVLFRDSLEESCIEAKVCK